MKNPLVWLMAGLLAIAAWLIVPLVWSGDGLPAVTENDLEDVVFVCQKTNAVFIGKARPTPAAHPATGETTLMPGLYCERCKKWRPSLPVDVLQRNPAAANCPIHKQPQHRDGPRPDTIAQI